MRVLIVEDDFLLALSLEDIVHQRGHNVVGTVSTSADALVAIAGGEVDLVLLDRSLADGPADGLAAALSDRGTPFIWMTGYDAGTFDARGAPVLSKPVQECQLEQVLSDQETGARP